MNIAILKSISSYAITSAITSGAGFIMLKYYTSVLTPSEFGVFALYALLINYTAMTIFFNSGSFDILYFKGGLSRHLSSTIFISSTAAVVTTATLFIFQSEITDFIGDESKSLFYISVVATVVVAAVKIISRIIINEDKPKIYLKTTITQNVSNHLSSFIIITTTNLDVLGRQIGYLIGQVLHTFQGSYQLDIRNKFKLTAPKSIDIKENIILSLPLFISTALILAFSYTDRLFLNLHLDAATVGIFSLALFTGKSISIINESVSLALFSRIMVDLTSDFEEGIKKAVEVQKKFVAATFAITLVIALASGLIIELISTPEYHEAKSITPLILITFMIGGFYKIPIIILKFKKIVKPQPYISFLCFGLGAILNYILIPAHGLAGAAVGTAIGTTLYSYSLNAICFKFYDKKMIMFTNIIFALAIATLITFT